MIELLSSPSMQRAFIAGTLLAALLAHLGVLVVIRKMAFFSSGIAHASLAGVAVGVFLSLSPFVTALIGAVFFAIGMFFLEKKTNLASDTVIGLIFTAGMALGVLLISFKEGYQPELVHFLFGDILTITHIDLILIVGLALLIGVFLILNARKFTLLALDREMAHLTGVNTDLFHCIFYVILAVSVVLALKILGVVLVSALLIIPVSISKLMSRSFKKLVFVSVGLSELIVVLGLLISAIFDLPAGAVIVLTGTSIFFLVLVLQRA
jgi:zinc transport system permease protein